MDAATDKADTDLSRAVKSARAAESAREDSGFDLREMEAARLSLLRDGLDGLVRELPKSHDDMQFAIVPGDPPRLWIDATTFVVLARDKRTYRVVKESRIGRTVLAESAAIEPIRQTVTRYVAERVVQRERALEDDWAAGWRAARREAAALPATIGKGGKARKDDDHGTAGIVWGLVGFVFGMAAGATLLFAVLRVRYGLI